MKKFSAAFLAVLMLMALAVPAMASEQLVGMANPWTEAASDEIAAATGLQLVIPDGVQAACSYMDGLAQAEWEDGSVSVTERVSAAQECPELNSESLTAQSGVYFEGLQTQSKELTVGGRCPGYMEFCKGEYGAIIWYDEELGVVYTVSLDPVSDPKELGDMAETITPPVIDEGETSMIVINDCAVAHDLTVVPVGEIEEDADFLWKVTDGYGITYTGEDGLIYGIYRAGQGGEFTIVVSAEDDPSPWTVGDQIWVGGSKLVELCVQDGVLTYILTDELVSGADYDVRIVDTASSGEASA